MKKITGMEIWPVFSGLFYEIVFSFLWVFQNFCFHVWIQANLGTLVKMSMKASVLLNNLYLHLRACRGQMLSTYETTILSTLL